MTQDPSSSTVVDAPPPDLAGRIVVGIDPGLDKHGVVALAAGSCRKVGRIEIPNTVAGMSFLAEKLSQWGRQSGGRLLVGIEEASSYGEALECYLSQVGFSVVVVSELQVARFKAVISGHANDLLDAEALARLLMSQPDLARTPVRQAVEADPQGSHHRRLRQLARRHARWTQENTAACNELHALLRRAWLADYQEFFSRIDGAAALAFWQRYPTPAEAAVAQPEAIAELLHQASHGRLKRDQSHQKARHIHTTARFMVAAFSRRDPQRWSAWSGDIGMLARHLQHLGDGLRQLKLQMDELLQEIKTPLTSFKGLGPILAATIHGEALAVARFPSADHFACYNGTAPREDSSGRRPRHGKNYRCNQHLRWAFMQLALLAPRYHAPSREYLARLQARGITGNAARLRLARRLSDVIYAMLKRNKEYDLEYFQQKTRPAA